MNRLLEVHFMFDIETLREYCLSQKGATEGLPFGPDVLVFKVMNKMFALLPLASEKLQINLKMDAELVPEYREKYTGVLPGYHMNKSLWNTVLVEHSDLSVKEIKWMIDHSYAEVVKKLPKKLQAELNAIN